MTTYYKLVAREEDADFESYGNDADGILFPVERDAESINDIIKQRDRAVVMAVKWCDRKHNDWQEVKRMLDKCIPPPEEGE